MILIVSLASNLSRLHANSYCPMHTIFYYGSTGREGERERAGKEEEEGGKPVFIFLHVVLLGECRPM